MIGNLGGSLAILATGYVLDLGVYWRAQGLGVAVKDLPTAEQTAGLMTGYQINFLIYAAVHVIGVVCWCLVDSTKPVVPDE
jgi:hypothetical protein